MEDSVNGGVAEEQFAGLAGRRHSSQFEASAAHAHTRSEEINRVRLTINEKEACFNGNQVTTRVRFESRPDSLRREAAVGIPTQSRDPCFPWNTGLWISPQNVNYTRLSSSFLSRDGMKKWNRLRGLCSVSYNRGFSLKFTSGAYFSNFTFSWFPPEESAPCWFYCQGFFIHKTKQRHTNALCWQKETQP